MSKKKKKQDTEENYINHELMGTFKELPSLIAKNDNQKKLIRSIDNNMITIGYGPSGCGKTFVSLLKAFYILRTSDIYKKIILIKSVTVSNGEDIGFIPGTVDDKMTPYMMSYACNIDKIFDKKDKIKDLQSKGLLEVQPLSYIRGMNLDNAIVIIDETQNIQTEMFKTIITRIGENTKYIILGDPEQNDRLYKESSCMSKIIEAFREHSDIINIVEFDDNDCVRNPIIPKILQVLRDNNL